MFYSLTIQDTVGCCKAVFTKWLDTQYDASWNQLLDALKSPSIQMNTLAVKIEHILDNSKCIVIVVFICKDAYYSNFRSVVFILIKVRHNQLPARL